MTEKIKFDPARLTAIRDIADERRAIAQNAFEKMREAADGLKAARAALVIAEQDVLMALPAHRRHFINAADKARSTVSEAEAALASADARYQAATAASESAGRLHAACREYAIEAGLIAHPQGGYVQKEAVA